MKRFSVRSARPTVSATSVSRPHANDLLRRESARPAVIAPPIIQKVTRSHAQPLGAETHAFVEPEFGHDFSGIRVHSNTDAVIIPLGKPDDRFELEADSVAEQVARAQRPEALAKIEVDTLDPRIQPASETSPPAVHEALQSPGQSLDPKIKHFMESQFQHDFSRVRIHADSVAETSTRAINARAFTFGQDIVFGTGQYVPETPDGKELLAHELVHVAQQVRGATTLRRQTHGKLKNKKNENIGTKAAPKLTITGVIPTFTVLD